MTDTHPNSQAFPPLDRVCKQRFPFTLACPSFVYPAGYIENVVHLAPFVDEIQLLFFESRPQSMPTPALIRELADIAADEGITYNVHLPADLFPGHPDPVERRRAADVGRQFLERCTPLAPSTFTLHLNRNPTDLPPLHLEQWQAHLADTLDRMLPPDIDRRHISVETLDYPFEQVAPLVAAAGCSICMDMGHLMVHDVDIKAFFARWQERITVVHLHGVAGKTDHLPLPCLSEERMQAVLTILQAFSGVVGVEVYSHAGLNASLAFLADRWPGDVR
jgi:hypothetical protein